MFPLGEPVREVCTDQRCGKCLPGVSDTLGGPVRPVGVCGGNVVLLRLWWDEVYSRHSVAQVARRTRDSNCELCSQFRKP
jgi:hypothetical protein